MWSRLLAVSVFAALMIAAREAQSQIVPHVVTPDEIVFMQSGSGPLGTPQRPYAWISRKPVVELPGLGLRGWRVQQVGHGECVFTRLGGKTYVFTPEELAMRTAAQPAHRAARGPDLFSIDFAITGLNIMDQLRLMQSPDPFEIDFTRRYFMAWDAAANMTFRLNENEVLHSYGATGRQLGTQIGLWENEIAMKAWLNFDRLSDELGGDRQAALRVLENRGLRESYPIDHPVRIPASKIIGSMQAKYALDAIKFNTRGDYEADFRCPECNCASRNSLLVAIAGRLITSPVPEWIQRSHLQPGCRGTCPKARKWLAASPIQLLRDAACATTHGSEPHD